MTSHWLSSVGHTPLKQYPFPLPHLFPVFLYISMGQDPWRPLQNSGISHSVWALRHKKPFGRNWKMETIKYFYSIFITVYILWQASSAYIAWKINGVEDSTYQRAMFLHYVIFLLILISHQLWIEYRQHHFAKVLSCTHHEKLLSYYKNWSYQLIWSSWKVQPMEKTKENHLSFEPPPPTSQLTSATRNFVPSLSMLKYWNLPCCKVLHTSNFMKNIYLSTYSYMCLHFFTK